MTPRFIVVFVALGILAVSVQIASGCRHCKEHPVVLPPNIAAALIGRGHHGYPAPCGLPPAHYGHPPHHYGHPPHHYGLPPAHYGHPPAHWYGAPPLVAPTVHYHNHASLTPAFSAGCGHLPPACQPSCNSCPSPTKFVQKPDVHITLPLPAEISLGKVCSVQKYALRPAVLPHCSNPCGRTCGCGCA